LRNRIGGATVLPELAVLWFLFALMLGGALAILLAVAAIVGRTVKSGRERFQPI
jgi:hypothetical protein